MNRSEALEFAFDEFRRTMRRAGMPDRELTADEKNAIESAIDSYQECLAMQEELIYLEHRGVRVEDAIRTGRY